MTDRWDDRAYLRRLGASLTQVFNVLVFNGMTDESVSARCWRRCMDDDRRWLLLYPVIELLFYPFDKGCHCYNAYVREQERLRQRWVSTACPYASAADDSCV